MTIKQWNPLNNTISIVSHHNVPAEGQVGDPILPEVGRLGVKNIANRPLYRRFRKEFGEFLGKHNCGFD
ncbi:hypothetical protein Y032_0042g510 [Ancylostoma ceylanicum]|uniref:Uncharacterized protein n=1 Tax=Ancylostoma ceylanicum TaxID=53326 RepID=A0A016UFW8_9BILA|nr:hypothetical protein Y032_0042g510 [Ancylostoma ceylanicum]